MKEMLRDRLIDVFSGNHPRAASLGLSNERVTMISASNIRCSVVTESGKVATWYVACDSYSNCSYRGIIIA